MKNRPIIGMGKDVTTQNKLKEKIKKNWLALLALFFIVLVSGAAYYPVLDNGFTNWDDPHYVTQNPYVRSLSVENVKAIFTKDIAFNYHPLTMLTLAVDCQTSPHNANGQITAAPFHRTNLMLHLFNVMLVFWFIMLLARDKLVAIVAALLFGIHPMHVESVAWVSERKDVLFAFFFLAGLVSYLYYLKRALKTRYLFIAFGLFLLSCLSKPTAVLFPLLLLLLDFYTRRKWAYRLLAEKIPFFLLSVLFGVKTLSIQLQATVGDWGGFSLFDRLLFTCYGLVAYLGKFFYPVHLTVHYAYPDTTDLPLVYYLAPLLVLVLAGIVAYSLKKTRVLAFGFLFFLVMNALTIQFLSVGSAIISERYSYLPYIGLYFMTGWLASFAMKRLRQPSARVAFLAMGGVCVLLLVQRTHAQSKVWENSRTLWENAIAVFPESPKGYAGLADYYLKEQRDKVKALEYLDKAVALGVNAGIDVYINRAKVYRSMGRLEKSLQDGVKAVEMDKTSVSALNCRGNAYFSMRQYDNALADFNKALELSEGQSYFAWANLGAVYFEQQQFEKSMQHLNEALSLYPPLVSAKLNRALAYSHSGQAPMAVSDYKAYLLAKPRHADGHFWLALELIKLGQLADALVSLNLAIKLKSTAGHFHQTRANLYRQMGNPAAAEADMQKAVKLEGGG